jgi:hypothetical protein
LFSIDSGGDATTRSDDTLTLSPLVVGWQVPAALPQSDHGLVSAGRQARMTAPLVGTRARYPWDEKLGIAVCRGYPPNELPTADFLAGDPLANPGFAQRTRRNQQNKEAIASRHGGEERYDRFDDFRDQYDQDPPAMPVPRVIAEDYPGSTDGFPSDESFAWQRLAGPNPMVIRLLTEFPKGDFPVEQVVLPPYFNTPEDWRRALRQRRLYICDYEIFTPIKPRGTPKYLPIPYALFYYIGERPKDGGTGTRPVLKWPGEMQRLAEDARIRRLPLASRVDLGLHLFGGGETVQLGSGLVPVAIQVDRGWDAVRNPIFTPLDEDAGDNRWPRKGDIVKYDA